MAMSEVLTTTALVRGGALAELFAKNSETILDLPRVRMRLEGLQVYATLAALLTNACLRLYSSVNFHDYDQDQDDENENEVGTSDNNNNNKNTQEGVDSGGDTTTTNNKKKNKIYNKKFGSKFINTVAADMFCICVVFSVLCGSYTTIVFGLFSILTKTALGRGYDHQFLQFWSQSASLRESGFESFLCSLVTFEVSFVLSLFLKFKGRRQKLLVIIASIILLLSIRRWTTLLTLASKLLFPLRAEVEY